MYRRPPPPPPPPPKQDDDDDNPTSSTNATAPTANTNTTATGAVQVEPYGHVVSPSSQMLSKRRHAGVVSPSSSSAYYPASSGGSPYYASTKNGSTGASTTSPSHYYTASSSSPTAPPPHQQQPLGGGYYYGTTTGSNAASAMPQAPPLVQAAASSSPAASPYPPNTASFASDYHHYRYNRRTACLWIPCWFAMYYSSNIARQVFIVFTVLMYLCDLANWRHATLYLVWLLLTVVQTCVNIWYLGLWKRNDDNDEMSVGTNLLQTAVGAMFNIVTSCWASLQCEWLLVQAARKSSSYDATTKQENGSSSSSQGGGSGDNNHQNNMPRQLEATVHGLLPPIFASLLTVQWTSMGWGDPDAAALAAPHLFAALLLLAMVFVGSVESSFVAAPAAAAPPLRRTSHHHHHPHDGNDDGDDNHLEPPEQRRPVMFAIRPRVARGHKALLLWVPGLLHFSLFSGRMFSPFASMDDVYDLVLAWTVPYLLWQFTLITITTNGLPFWSRRPRMNHHLWKSPYSTRSDTSTTTHQPKRTLAVWMVLVAFSWALQQRYLIPMSHFIAYHLLSNQITVVWSTFYWTVSTACLFAAAWIWGRTTTIVTTTPTASENDGTAGEEMQQTQQQSQSQQQQQQQQQEQPLFGEYHEDSVQLCLACAGLCLGKVFGLPWNMTPLPVLGLLGFSLWATTRMLRYLSIVLFVLHATGVVVFTYRFVGIDQPMYLPLYFGTGLELSLVRFGMMVTMTSILAGLAAGLAVRSSGGYMAPLLKQVDLTGAVLIIYVLVLTILEITLLKRPIPAKELVGVQLEEDEELEEMLYNPVASFGTSAILVGISLFMRKVRILPVQSSSIIVAMAVGKAAAIFIDAQEQDAGGRNDDPKGTQVFLRSLVTALLCTLMFAPRLFLEPVHVKASTRYRRSLSGGPDLPPKALRMFFFYAFIFLPVTLISTIPYVLFPLVSALAGGSRSNSYYSVSTPISELIGATICLWGLGCLAMLNHYLPDGGGEAWKKLAALAFIMGVAIVVAAPTFGMSVGDTVSSPYASMSSLGSQLVLRSKSRTGGWGMLSAALATLLAATGPLELRERRRSSGRKDKHLLFRMMIFSLLFGGGFAWFITVQIMSESDWLFLILTLMASMTLAFFGTVASVLGHFVELQNFDEVEQVAKFWMLVLVAFLPIAGLPQLIRSSAAHPFGQGGWLSTYLIVAGMSAFSFSLSLSSRQDKSSRSRGMGNLGVVIAWLCAIAVLYGRYGVAELDGNFDINSMFSIPLSVFGTLLVAPLLLALEGETTAQARGRRVSVATPQTSRRSSTGLILLQLTRGNRWFPLFLGSISVLLCASLYAILLRGSGIFSVFGVPTPSHNDVASNLLKRPSMPFSTGVNDFLNLAAKAAEHSHVLAKSKKLAASGFWTATGFFVPLLHLAGVFATLPSLYLLVQHYWWSAPIPSGQVILGVPLNAIPVLLCRNLASLQTAAILTVAAALAQLVLRRRSEQASRMRI